MKELLKPTGAVLVGIAFLLYFQACVAAPEGSSSLERVMEFHQQFKKPTASLNRGWSENELLPAADLAGFANRDSSPNGPSGQLQGLIAINNDKRRNLEYNGLLESPSAKTNFMDIEVSRITVIAINMAKDGNAVATSDIVLNPVQYSGSSSSEREVEEKLR